VGAVGNAAALPALPTIPAQTANRPRPPAGWSRQVGAVANAAEKWPTKVALMQELGRWQEVGFYIFGFIRIR